MVGRPGLSPVMVGRADELGRLARLPDEDDEGIAWVLGQADEVGMDVTDAEVAVVLETELEYFEAIGAIGGAVPEPPDDAGDSV